MDSNFIQKNLEKGEGIIRKRIPRERKKLKKVKPLFF